MSYLEELLPEFRKGAKIRRKTWGSREYLFNRKNNVISQDGTYYDLDSDDLMADDWELYQEPIDWDYIIKNKCLCWFWDEREEHRVAGILVEDEQENPDYRFKMSNRDKNIVCYRHCRTVRRDEVTFYEDKEDE